MGARVVSGGFLGRTSGLPTITSSFTACGWVRLNSLAAGYQNVFSIENGTSNAAYYVSFGIVGTGKAAFDVQVANSGTVEFFTENGPTVGGRFFWFVRVDASTSPDSWTGGYSGAVGDFTTRSVNLTSTMTPATMRMGNNTYNEYGDMTFDNVRMWTAALTDAELKAERNSGVIVKTSNVYGNYLLTTNVNEMSGGTALTYNGTQSFTGIPAFSEKLVRNKTNPLIANGSAGTYDATKAGPRSIVVTESLGVKTYHMIYEAIKDDGGLTTTAAYATSSDGCSWTKYGSNPIITGSESWENNEIAPTSLFWDSSISKWVLYYHGGHNSSPRQIGRATADSISGPWTKYASNPVFSPGAASSWDEDNVADCKVMKVGSTYHMFYAGDAGPENKIGHATSSDGITWTRDSSNPVFVKNSSGWDNGEVQSPGVVYHQGLFHMFYVGDNGDDGLEKIGYASSSNGTTWTRGSSNPVLESISPKLIGDTANVYVDDNIIRVQYGEFDFTGSAIRSIAEATFELRGGFPFGATAITTSAPVLDTATFSTPYALTATGITTGSPTLDNAALAQLHALIATAPSIGPPSVSASTLTQKHSLTANNVASGGAVLESPTLSQGFVFGANSITTQSPVIESASISQKHGLGAEDIESGAPVFENPEISETFSLTATDISTTFVVEYAAITQHHALISQNITPPGTIIENAVLVQAHILAASGIAAQPIVESPTLSQAGELAALDIVAQPVLESPLFSQQHVLSAGDIQSGQIILESPSMSQSGDFLALDIVAQPFVDVVILSQKHILGAFDIQIGQPILESPSLSGSLELSANGITTQAPTIESAALTQNHLLNALAIEVGSAALEQISISQRHNLIANILLLGPPILGNANVFTGQRALTRTTLIVERPIPQYQVTKNQRIFVGGRRNKVYEVI